MRPSAAARPRAPVSDKHRKAHFIPSPYTHLIVLWGGMRLSFDFCVILSLELFGRVC